MPGVSLSMLDNIYLLILVILVIYIYYMMIKYLRVAIKGYSAKKEQLVLDRRLKKLEEKQARLKRALVHLRAQEERKVICMESRKLVLSYVGKKLDYKDQKLYDKIRKKEKRF